jgi:nucleotide-binding universal stress UspA family protein
MTSRILVPYDGSEMSDKALDKAIDFSKAFKSEIIILHILDDRLIPSNAILGFIGERSGLEDANMQALKILKMGAEAMLKDRIEKGGRISIRYLWSNNMDAKQLCFFVFRNFYCIFSGI